jgi:hypothetical protein
VLCVQRTLDFHPSQCSGCALEIKRQAVAEERNTLPRASNCAMWQDIGVLYAALQGVLYAALHLVT